MTMTVLGALLGLLLVSVHDFAALPNPGPVQTDPSSQVATALKVKVMVLASPQVCRNFGH